MVRIRRNPNRRMARETLSLQQWNVLSCIRNQGGCSDNRSWNRPRGLIGMRNLSRIMRRWMPHRWRLCKIWHHDVTYNTTICLLLIMCINLIHSPLSLLNLSTLQFNCHLPECCGVLFGLGIWPIGNGGLLKFGIGGWLMLGGITG